jgi:2-keto-4-pentenoate hydratase
MAQPRDRLDQALLDAERHGAPITDLAPFDALTQESAFAVQDAVLRAKIGGGQVVIGAKVAAVPGDQQAVTFGRLTDAAVHPLGRPLATTGMIAPRVAPGLVFQLGADVSACEATISGVLAATSGVMPAIDIEDSRLGAPVPTAAALLADSASSGRLVLGGRLRRPDELDLALLGVLWEADGDLVTTTAGAAAFGHPAQGVAELAGALARFGERLRAGMLVFSGALAPYLEARGPRHVQATFAHLGAVHLRTE